MISNLRPLISRVRRETIESGSLCGRFVRGAVWCLAGTSLANALQMAASVLAARMLGKVGFGELGIINSTVGALGVFAGLGLGTTATKFVAEHRTLDPDRAGRILGLTLRLCAVFGGAASIALFFLAPMLSERALKAPHLVIEMRLACGLLFFNALNGPQTSGLAGLEAFQSIARVNLARGLLSFPALVAGVWLFGLPGAVGAMALTGGIGCWINHVALQSECRRAGIKISGGRRESSDFDVLWRFSIPVFVSIALVAPVTWVGNAMLVRQPHGYAQMGVFNAVSQWRTTITFLLSVFVGVNLPMLSNLFGLRDRAGFLKVLRGSLLAVLALAIPVAAPVIFLAPWVMGLYGRGYAHYSPLLLITALTSIVITVATVTGHAILSMGAIWRAFIYTLLWAAAFLASTWLFVGQGARGLVLAYLVSYSLYCAVVIIHVLRARSARTWSETKLEVGG